MLGIAALNVNDAYAKGLDFIREHGVIEQTRVGECLVVPQPVITAYMRPQERVLWDAQRNANPFFHLAEALWMLAGRHDADWLDKFVGDFSSRFAEENGLQHGAYGFRWRQHFEMEWGGRDELPDQLETIVKLLKANPSDRRVVLTMWDPVADLAVSKKDIPCNTHIYFRVRNGAAYLAEDKGRATVGPLLDMTVCCRSNDMVWGAYGANAVHFSVLQEYVAARLGIAMGVYYQFSNNFHAYTATLPEPLDERDDDLYVLGVVQAGKIVTDAEHFLGDLRWFFEMYDGLVVEPPRFHNPFLREVAWPMFKLYERRRKLTQADLIAFGNDRTASDWSIAAVQWLDRWMRRRKV